MQDKIKLLPDSVANQIAAGEVIQQPSSVVKELVENSVDAGASKIDIYIRDAGRTLIQVVDDGCGMTPTDARLAFERHSTSKIREAKDLFALSTMGFRGEALASIAAISQLDVRTMPHDATIGTRIVINGSKVESQQPEVTSPGTNFMVKNIFFNLPVRRKFLKKDTVEFSNILHEFERLALVNPEVEMSLCHNDNLVFGLGKSNLKTRIGELFGRSVEDSLVPVSAMTELVNISGFVGSPASARKRGALQYFFVNGRNMRHPYFRKAVLNCFEPLISPDAQPNYFINFDINPEAIDINIHPTKNEIKFENENAIWQILIAAVREALGRFNLGPSLDFGQISEIDILPRHEGISEDNIFAHPRIGGTSYNPFAEGNETIKEKRLGEERRNLMFKDTAAVSYEQEPLIENQAVPEKYLQLGGKYILSPSGKGLYVIDQREAHIKVLYENFLHQFNQKTIVSQNLLFTTIFNVDPSQSIILESILDVLSEWGFLLDKKSDEEWEIRAIPSLISGSDGRGALLGILNNIMDETVEGDDGLGELQHSLALNLACSVAIKSGQLLTTAEIDNLIGGLFATSTPALSPRGRKIIAEIGADSFDKLLAN